ncbi:LysE family translocator [Pseudomonas sp. Marseille-QA0892]
MSVLVSMAAFALVTSITPGPVNLMAMSSGARFGLRPSLAHAFGAAAGFTLLLVAIGGGLQELLQRWPSLLVGIRLAGIVYLLYLAVLLWRDDGRVNETAKAQPPSMLSGALMQWLNPKAWLASFAGMGAFAADGNRWTITLFAIIYLLICFMSVGSWAWAGGCLRQYLHNARRMRVFNRSMSALLAASAAYLLVT